MSPEERQREAAPARGETAIRIVSLAIAAGILVLIALDPARAGSHGAVTERAAGAAMLVGAIACAVRGMGLRGKRRHVRLLLHPGFCWALALAGFVAHLIV
jgi:uncharacterized membrane protein